MKGKARLRSLPAVATALFLATAAVRAGQGMANNTAVTATPSPVSGEEISVLDHFPLLNGLSWKYRSNLGDVSSRVIIDGDRVTIISESSPLDIRQTLQLTPDGLFLTEAESDTFLLSTRRTYHPFLLRFPRRVAVGKSWEWKGREVVDGDIIESRVEGVIDGWETVAVPAGEFRCLKVTVRTVSDDGTTSSSTQWLASGIGIVRADIKIDAGGLSGFIISLLGFDSYHLELEEMNRPEKK
ncbi:MAG: hypothetical protein V1789_03010 [PVC group bacterium]